MMDIRFYSTKGEYGAFSNFAAYPIYLDGKEWPTTEHYFQAQKFPGTPHAERIRKKAKTPKMAADMGRDRSVKLRRDWDKVKVSVMMDALYAKFTQYPELETLLLSTGDSKLVEHTSRDDYWGDGGDGSGKNMLGQLLMELREYLREN